MPTTGVMTITKDYTVTIGTDETKVQAASTVTLANVIKRLLTVPTASEVEIFNVAATVGAGTVTDMGIMLVQNRHATDTCRIRVSISGGLTFDIPLKAGQAFDLYSIEFNVSETEAAFVSYSNLETISAQFATTDGELLVVTGEDC